MLGSLPAKVGKGIREGLKGSCKFKERERRRSEGLERVRKAFAATQRSRAPLGGCCEGLGGKSIGGGGGFMGGLREARKPSQSRGRGSVKGFETESMCLGIRRRRRWH